MNGGWGVTSASEGSLSSMELAQRALDELDDSWNQSKVALTNSPILNTPLAKTFLILLNIFPYQRCRILGPKSCLPGRPKCCFLCAPTTPSAHPHQTVSSNNDRSHAALACTLSPPPEFQEGQGRDLLFSLFPAPLRVWHKAGSDGRMHWVGLLKRGPSAGTMSGNFAACTEGGDVEKTRVL